MTCSAEFHRLSLALYRIELRCSPAVLQAAWVSLRKLAPATIWHLLDAA